MGKVNEKEDHEEEGQKLCPKCGNVMIEEDGELVCSSCVNEIDFFGEEGSEDTTEDEL